MRCGFAQIPAQKRSACFLRISILQIKRDFFKARERGAALIAKGLFLVNYDRIMMENGGATAEL